MFDYFKKCNLISFKMFKIVNILEISINIIENLENTKKKEYSVNISSDIFFLPIFYYKKI